MAGAGSPGGGSDGGPDVPRAEGHRVDTKSWAAALRKWPPAALAAGRRRMESQKQLLADVA